MQTSISVVIPTYNRGALIEKTVASVLNQDLPPEEVEVLIVDDGSTDDTWDVLQQLYGNQAQVRLFRLENGGVARARNFGLEQARGEFIAYLDHDDLWLPAKLRLQRDILLQHPEIGVVCCLWHDRTEDGEIIPGHQILQADPKWNLPHGHIFGRLLRNNFIVSMTIPMLRTALLQEVGGLDVAMVPCDDWDLWIRLAQRCQFGVVREVGAIYQRHSSQQSSDERQMLQATQRLLREHLTKRWWVAAWHLRAVWVLWSMAYFIPTQQPFYHLARSAINEGDWRQVRRMLRNCQKRFPLILFTPQWLYILVRLLRRDSRPF